MASLFGGEAFAQTRAAVVKNVDEPGRMPYQQLIEFNTSAPVCPISQGCLVAFPPVPAGKRLIVERATLLLGVFGGTINFWGFGDGLGINSGNTAILKADFTPALLIAGVQFFAGNQDTLVYFEAGATPKLKILTTAPVSFVGNASLHGYLIDATN
jgi:hypothetical protein